MREQAYGRGQPQGCAGRLRICQHPVRRPTKDLPVPGSVLDDFSVHRFLRGRTRERELDLDIT